MTIPIQAPQIHPQFVQNQQTPGLEVLARALQQRQELDIARQRLRREQEQFELNKRIAGTEIEGQELLNAERKKKIKDAEDALLARDQAYQIYAGNLTRADDMKGWGEVIAGVKDRAVGEHLMGYIKELFQTMALQGKPPTDSYSSLGVSPSGNAVLLNTKTGQTRETGQPLQRGGAGTRAFDQKVKLGARNAARAIRQAIELVQRDPDANFKPALSDIAGSAAESRLSNWVPGLKGAAGWARRRAMSPNQNKFQNLLNIVAHNSVGLLPGTRQSIVLFNNLRDSYSTDAGDPPELRALKLENLADLGRSLEALERGEDVSLAHLPGFEEFTPFEGTAPTKPTNTRQPIQQTPGTTITPRFHRKFRNTTP